MYRGLASMEKTIDGCNISEDELDCKLTLVFHCRNGEERERVRECDKERGKNRERKRQKGKEKERQEKKQGMMISLKKNFCAYIKGLGSLCWRQN